MWNDKSLEALIETLQLGMNESGDMGDMEAFDVADGVLAMEEGLEDYLRNEKGIADPMGYIANYIG